MQIAIMGGKLQGLEAAYLARKAGWQTLLFDENPSVPASGLCDRTIRVDIHRREDLLPHLNGVDLIIPALEDQEALVALKLIADKCGIPMAFDPVAYAVTSSKLKSNQLFSKMGFSMPEAFPDCGFPMVVKPDDKSGSHGVEVISGPEMFENRFEGSVLPGGWVAQRFVPGPSYSVEVIGMPGRYIMPQVTDLHMDEQFDCKCVTAPSNLPANLTGELEAMALWIAATIELNGIMDVEVILDRELLRIIEIDARLPSQTPAAVYWSTGLNMLTLMKDLFVDKRMPLTRSTSPRRSVRLEHISVTDNQLKICGEHIMAHTGPVQVKTDFFGADEAITNYRAGSRDWVATLIHSANDPTDLMGKRASTMDHICRSLGLTGIVDSTPKSFGQIEKDQA